jgi:monothiol glutaredoxin
MKGSPEQPMCGFSRGITTILNAFDISPDKFKTYNVLEDLELRTGIKEFSEWPTIPKLYVNGEFVGGSDITLSMFQSGELETLLKQHGVILEK